MQPEFVTVLQISASVPQGVEPGDAVPVHVRISGQLSQEGVTMVCSPPCHHKAEVERLDVASELARHNECVITSYSIHYTKLYEY